MKTISIALLALFCLLSEQEPLPVVTGFYPSWGYPGQVIKVEGTDLGHPEVYWDGDLVPNSSLTGIYIQIPSDARRRPHQIELRYGGRRARPHNYTVRERIGTWPQPRIEDVAIQYFAPDTSSVALTIAVANGDIYERVKVSMRNGAGSVVICDPCSAALHSAIASDRFNTGGQDPLSYGYPIYHYISLLVNITPPILSGQRQILGRTLVVEVFNNDGLSNSKEYKMPDTLSELDSDNDGLLDRWEISGFPRESDPTQLIDLGAMGCDPQRKDILIEVDWMPSALPDSFITIGNMWGRIEEVYLNAPVLNPDGTRGIKVHIDRGQDRDPSGGTPTGPFTHGNTPILDFDYVGFGRRPPGLTGTYMNYCILKSRWFDPDREDIFHYCIIGNGGGNGGSGRAESPGNEFIITTVRLPNPLIAGSVEAMIGTFVHELGHNLGLHHGGLIADPPLPDTSTVPFSWQPHVLEQYKPNQPSSMNYRYGLKGISLDCDLCADVPAVHGYSEGMLKEINEASVDERAGVCNNSSIDFHFDGILSASVRANTNGVHPSGADPLLCIGHSGSNDVDSTDVFHDDDEWGNLQLNWRASGLYQNPPRWWWGCR